MESHFIRVIKGTVNNFYIEEPSPVQEYGLLRMVSIEPVHWYWQIRDTIKLSATATGSREQIQNLLSIPEPDRLRRHPFKIGE